MLDSEKISEARAKGVCFTCAMCTLWYKGVKMKLRLWDGTERCAAVNGCGGPLSGGSFEEYDGPLKGYLVKFCYVCGSRTPEHALAAKVPNSQKIGCCAKCLDKVKELVHMGDEDRNVIKIAEHLAPPDKHEVLT